jgi:hypothetical protein
MNIFFQANLTLISLPYIPSTASKRHHYTSNLSRPIKMAPQEHPQPFRNRPETFAYIPRRDGDPPIPHQPHSQPHLVPHPQIYYYPPPWFVQQAYAGRQSYIYPAIATPAPIYYYPQPQYHPWYPGYGPQAAGHVSHPSQPQVARLPDGRLPWYGRTPQEVADDAAKAARAHDKPEDHVFAPTAEPSKQFWCKLPEGDYKMIQLGTINNTWKGVWKHDPIHDRVYFVASELK